MIAWEQHQHRFERVVQALLRRLHPGLRSLDGSGGDGGKDALLVTEDGRTVFEMKSFLRLTQSRRRQVQRSLVKAVANAPTMTTWVLVAPTNMTPVREGSTSSEEAWFDTTLAALAPGVDLQWWGQDWLDGQFADHQDLQRYLEGADSQLLKRASEHDREQSVLGNGAADLLDRNAVLRRRVDEVSPYWTLDWSVRDGIHTSVLRAKDPEAPTLDPITLTPTFSFDPSDLAAHAVQKQLVETLDFGGSIELPAGYVTEFRVDASPEARKLIADGDPRSSEFHIYTSRETLSPPVRSALMIVDATTEAVVASMEVYFRSRANGNGGVTLYGGDAAEVLSLTVKLPRPPDPENGGSGEVINMTGTGLNMNIPTDLAGHDVDALLPVLGLLADVGPGHAIKLDLPGLGYIQAAALSDEAIPGAKGMHQLVADLRRMQEQPDRPCACRPTSPMRTPTPCGSPFDFSTGRRSRSPTACGASESSLNGSRSSWTRSRTSRVACSSPRQTWRSRSVTSPCRTGQPRAGRHFPDYETGRVSSPSAMLVPHQATPLHQRRSGPSSKWSITRSSG
jgi:hypothetical protein